MLWRPVQATGRIELAFQSDPERFQILFLKGKSGVVLTDKKRQGMSGTSLCENMAEAMALARRRVDA